MIRSVLIVLALAVTLKAEEWESRDARWGRTSFRVVVPSAMSGSDALRDSSIRASIPPNIDLIASYYSPNERWSYAVVQGFRPNREAVATTPVFIKQREQIKSGLAEATKVANTAFEEVDARWRTMKSEGQLDAGVVFERPVLFGVFDESDAHFSTLMLAAVTEPDGESQKRTVILASSSMILIRGKVITLVIYRRFAGKASYDEIRELTREAVHRTIEANG